MLLTSPQPVIHSRSLISLQRQLRRSSRSYLLLKEQEWVFLHPLKGWKKYKVTPRYREVAAGDFSQTAFYLAAGLGALDLETADSILVFLGFGQGCLGTSYPTCRLKELQQCRTSLIMCIDLSGSEFPVFTINPAVLVPLLISM